jgi:hypothetical protein
LDADAPSEQKKSFSWTFPARSALSRKSINATTYKQASYMRLTFYASLLFSTALRSINAFYRRSRGEGRSRAEESEKGGSKVCIFGTPSSRIGRAVIIMFILWRVLVVLS